LSASVSSHEKIGQHFPSIVQLRRCIVPGGVSLWAAEPFTWKVGALRGRRVSSTQLKVARKLILLGSYL